MEKERAIELWQDKLGGEITPENDALLRAFMLQHPEVATELKQVEQTWNLFAKIEHERPEPSLQMDARFEGMMAGFTSVGKPKNMLLTQVLHYFQRGWQMGVICLIMGIFFGWWILPSQTQRDDIRQLSGEIESMKEMMMLTLIEQPKAQERIRAVNMVSQLDGADAKVIDALVFTLQNDVNVNVRLASLESLLNYSHQAEVRRALVDALGMQDSPILMVAIADALVAIQETSSIKTMRKLKEQSESDLVKEKLESSIQTLSNI